MQRNTYDENTILDLHIFMGGSQKQNENNMLTTEILIQKYGTSAVQ
jgi:hypothetical protein